MRSKLAGLFSPWKPLSDIPNQKNFKFVGLLNDGREAILTVVKDEDSGCFTVGSIFSQLKSWRDLTAEDENA